ADAGWTNWVWGIARRVARGYRRGAGRRERLHAMLPRAGAEVALDDALARRRALEFLDGFLAGLPAPLLEAFVLTEIEGCTAPEIAARTGVNLNTIYTRVRTVRRRFDEAIAAELAPARTRAWWMFALPAWTPVATTACVALTIGFATLELPGAAPTVVAEARVEPPPRIADEPAKDPVMAIPARKLVTPIVAGVLAGTLAVPSAQAKPKAKRAKATAVQKAPAPASDQDADDAARRGSEGGTTVYWFEGDEVGGEVLTPGGMQVNTRARQNFESMIELRPHFLPELVTAARDV
ncbi:MAG TPA: sigma factor-like helix-turn-helix DNA-binding protein, partial [Nannocystaceae bacterium]|nr:sigma factor-like helix-turn-helix DNA-binding protein [Nannocystaceae bacterium]